MNSRRISIIIAIVVALAVALLTVQYLSSVDHTSQQKVTDTRSVIVASRDIHAREKITPEMLQEVKRPVDQVAPNAVTDAHAVEGDVAQILITEGSTLTEDKIARPSALGVPSKLPVGMRAVSIPMDYIKSVSGLINPGDKVDVMASYMHGNNAPPTRTIIRGALVLAVNSDLEPTDSASPAAGGSGNAPAAVTLAVTPAQADLLTFADLNTTIRLALRPESEPARSQPVEPIDIPDLNPAPREAAPAAAPVAPAPVAVPVAPRPSPKPSSIIVIEGDHVVGNQ